MAVSVSNFFGAAPALDAFLNSWDLSSAQESLNSLNTPFNSSIFSLAEDPLFSGVVLECTVIEPRTTCSCGYKGTEKFVCPGCGGLPEILRGREIVVSNIEIEVADS